ncbi:uncharacterized protein N7506_000691 [Penicillium brevicompactum]|uniref:uncharacterized protein n=1 Tax=Penicillium brevicompactum TaxID=5074 RepID=UPI00254098E4|nr:uncharacterized protein N7506_000691 [Penicillium brevicompactum]KAJ5347438.1 hypothetical protein N7506_000691 [Penicillium brevicompactum]
MQSILQHRRIRRKLEQQIVTKHGVPEDVWTQEGRYYYRDGEIHTHPREPDDNVPAIRRREHGHRTIISGPTVNRHSARTHLERDGDVERADIDPELQTDPHTINTQETLGNTTDMMVTGVERAQPGSGVATGVRDGVALGADGSEIDSVSDMESIKKNKIIIVTFEGDLDLMDPHNWSFMRRLGTTLLTSFIASVMFWSSTIDATAHSRTVKLFHTSFEVQTLPTTFYLVGLGVGALVTAPFSELFGRTPVYIPTTVGFMLFNMAAALSHNVVQRIICRGIAGFFGSAPAVIAGASLVDVWSRVERVYAFPIFAIMGFSGALVGPIPGSFVVNSRDFSWRWVDWITIIYAGVILILIIFLLPETYSPILLYWKAKELRRLTGDERYRSPLEFNKVPFAKRLRISLYRPILLFITEPIISIHAVYLSILFIVLYTFIAGYVSIFEKANGFKPTEAAIAFLGIEVGVLLSALTVPLAMWLLRRDIRRSRAQGQSRPDPEISLYMGMFGAPFIPVSLFWMGWTSRLSISYWSPLIASVFFGFGTLCVFVSAFQYVADAFELNVASALSTLQMMRLVTAGVMAIVSEVMYKKLGTGWTLTLLGCLSFLFLPVPYVLYWKGEKVRSWSKYARGN